MDWDDIRVFLELARQGSLSATARHLKVDHTTVARRVDLLEARLGVKLFDRLPRGYVLTGDGETLLSNAERMEAEAIALQRQASGAASELQGVVRLAAPPVVASHFIAPRLTNLRKTYPGIRLELIGGKDSANLSRREADLAIRLLKPTDSGLIARRLGLLAYGLYGARDYLRRRKPETFDYLGYDDSLEHVPQQRWLQRQANGKPLAFAANDLASLYLATRSGLGVAALPYFLGAADAKLSCLAVAGAAADREVWLLVHPDLRRAPRVRMVMDYLIAMFERETALLAGREKT